MRHPYSALPDHQFWSKAVVAPAAVDVDPVVTTKFKLRRNDAIATAGSCFAQHISRSLKAVGFNFMQCETPHPLVADHAKAFNYGTYSARFGNIYSARQLLQLFQRSYGLFEPRDVIWGNSKGRYVDPFRPQIQPDGFASATDLLADRKQHMAAVRTMVETCDVFIFTLGLTEVWSSRHDGAVFPLCPGVVAGTFDPETYRFENLTVEDVTRDLSSAIAFLQEKNSMARVICTVSPVPLVATYEHQSALVATTYSKSVLRVAADAVRRTMDLVDYFPSYEVVTGGYTRGQYFADDLRSVTPDGVAHVMRLFMKHFTDAGGDNEMHCADDHADQKKLAMQRRMAAAAGLERLLCDEEALATKAPKPVTAE